MNETQDLLRRFSDQVILVVGDCMLDEYVHGDVRRISPEAPVPVVDVDRVEFLPGGAANTALNVRALGAKCKLIGVVGQDQAGEQLLAILQDAGVEIAGIVNCADRPTTKKTRIVARSQQIARLDIESDQPVEESVQQSVLTNAEVALRESSCCVLSDYSKGLFTTRLCRALIAESLRARVTSLVDPKGRDFSKYARATLVKPNHLETETAVNRAIRGTEDLSHAAADLRSRLDGAALLITRGADGMSYFGEGEPVHLPTQAATVYDVTGAGDTVISTLAVAHAAGADLLTAARIANLAAAVAVSRQGTVAVTHDELTHRLKI